MALLEMPIAGVQSAKFRLDQDVSTNQRASGFVSSVQRSDPRWSVEISTGKLERAQYQIMRTFWDECTTLQHDFLLHDPAHPRPIHYRAGFTGLTRSNGTAFSGTAHVDALTKTTISISGLPNGFKLAYGDYVGLVEGDYRGLHKVIDQQKTASGGTMTVSVLPLVKTNVFSSAASVNLEKPHARFMPIPNSDDFSFGLGPIPFSFKAIQRII
ncbi:hypothetical protein [Roseibium sp. RKSG952]|uniref:hypothetical protein n=1 Tax=Roseibium sp. RKSG952 TaxID=2529384 RepID=UPI0012BB9CB8|nr:hypothetical protein [Roseibium sp. RKSG952]MTH95180.1 hypothetical protein [Roseibium sp. RKSG952]